MALSTAGFSTTFQSTPPKPQAATVPTVVELRHVYHPVRDSCLGKPLGRAAVQRLADVTPLCQVLLGRSPGVDVAPQRPGLS